MEWKRALAVLMAMLVVAALLPSAIAERGRGSGGGLDDGSGEIETEYEDGVLKERIKVRNDTHRVEIRKENGLRTERREIAQEVVLQSRERIREHHGRLAELRLEHKGARDGFVNARAEFKVKCEDRQSEECRKAQADLVSEAKGYMGNSAEQILRILEEAKARISADAHIDAQTAANMTAQLDARARAVAAAQAKIEALNGTDMNATKAAAEELRTAWMQARTTINLAHGLLANARFQAFLVQLDTMERRLTQARDELAAQGKDVAALNASLSAFSAHVDASAAAYAQARDSYIDAMGQATTPSAAQELLKQTREQLKEAKDGAGEAREDLREIVREIRALDATVLTAVAADVGSVHARIGAQARAQEGQVGRDGVDEKRNGTEREPGRRSDGPASANSTGPDVAADVAANVGAGGVGVAVGVGVNS